MRTTITLDDDVAAAVERLRKITKVGLSEAVNELVRAGLRAPRKKVKFVQRTRALGLKIDVSNIGEALELMEGPHAR
jgi:Arc/MetJ family transcription regulator